MTLASGLLAGCAPVIGPLRVTLGTQGETERDVVVYSSLYLASFHAHDVVHHEPRVVASEEEVWLGPWLRSPRSDGYALSIYHPRYQHVWHRESGLGGGPRNLRIELVPWQRVLERGPVQIEEVLQHLGLLTTQWLPAIPVADRGAIRAYLPELRALVARSRYVAAERGYWRSEGAARAAAEEKLAALEAAAGESELETAP